MKYSSVTGGGTWYTNYYGTESFDHETTDLRMDVTPVINYILQTTASKSAPGTFINDQPKHGRNEIVKITNGQEYPQAIR